MKWENTIASDCRYGEIAANIWGDWDIVWENSDADYQGHATILAEKDGAYCFYEWWYGSCSGCDDWEARDLTDAEIEAEMRERAAWLADRKALEKWLTMLEGPIPSNNIIGGIPGLLDKLSCGLLDRINGVRQALGMEKLDFNNNE
jgi:hypothetical protein